jgi:hypothetical protein
LRNLLTFLHQDCPNTAFTPRKEPFKPIMSNLRRPKWIFPKFPLRIFKTSQWIAIYFSPGQRRKTTLQTFLDLDKSLVLTKKQERLNHSTDWNSTTLSGIYRNFWIPNLNKDSCSPSSCRHIIERWEWDSYFYLIFQFFVCVEMSKKLKKI